LIAAGLVDRLIVAVAPIVIGAGIDGVGDLGIDRVSNAFALENRTVTAVGDDVLIAGDLERRTAGVAV
jgi:riboflavin biosynthesis pyrimidine reductase